MTILKQFPKGSRAAVIGASGGIGSAFVTLLADEPCIDHVYALSRSKSAVDADGVYSLRIDYESQQSIATAAELIAIDGPLDLVIVATGILHENPALQPEKTMADLEADNLARVLAVNTIGPALVARYFLPLMRRDRRSVFAALSARVGSIADNRLGGWLAYRASKAALNMAIKTLSIEQARKRPDCLVVALHPGTVQTDLSAPFTGRVADDKLFSPTRAADQLLTVIDELPADATGGFFAWDGERIPY